MKTMKENWVCPDVQVQVFSPQEFVATCQGYEDAYTATCRSSSCLIFFDDGNYISDANRGGCGKSHVFRESDGVDLTELREGNCWLLINVTGNTAYSTSNIDYYIEQGWIEPSGDDYKIPDNMVNTLKTTKELVRGYYNSQCLGGGWLVTDELQKIVPAS